MQNRHTSIGILPFENLSGSIDDGRLVAGFVQDLIAELARFPSLWVIAPESAIAAGASGLDDTGIGRRLAVDFLLKGSLRRSDRSLRLTAQLVQIASGQHLWVERYDVFEEEVFSVLDEIAAKVVNALISRIDQSVLRASRRRHITKLSAYACWLRGMESLQRGTMESDDEARAFFEQALAVDPQYARAQAGLSLSHFNEWSCQAWGCWEAKEKAAYECARKAEEMDPDDPLVQVILGKIEQYRRQHEIAESRYRRALHLAPNDAFVLIQITVGFAMLGEGELAANSGERALRLNPMGPPWWFYCAALPYFVQGNYSRALELGLRTPIIVTDGPAYLAAACAYLGDQTGARNHMETFEKVFVERITMGRAPEPGEALRWLLHVNPFRREEDLQHFSEGVRLAGLQESASQARTPPPTLWPVGNVFRKEGALWMACFEHEVVHVPEMRGLQDLAKLLGQPGEELHCLALVGQVMDRHSGVEILDDQSKRAYRKRLQDIEAELDEAGEAHDPGRAHRLEEERERLLEEMRQAAGLGGRDRKIGDVAERARTAVAWRIRHAIKKLESAHPRLARHLGRSIKTGVYCSYQPENEIRWFV